MPEGEGVPHLQRECSRSTGWLCAIVMKGVDVGHSTSRMRRPREGDVIGGPVRANAAP